MSASANRSRRIALISALTVVGVLLGALAIWWFLENHHRVKEEIKLDPKGEASYNPLYALKLSLRDAGQRVESRQRLRLSEHALRPADTVLMVGDLRALPEADAEGLLDWVSRGGHLIVTTPSPGVAIDDADVPLLTELGIAPYDDIPECMGLQVDKLAHHDEFCGGRRFYFYDEDAQVRAEWAEENEDGLDYGFARVAWGKGTVDVLAELDFLTNDKLEDVQHQALTRQLLQPNWEARGTFHLIYSADMPPLWKLLLDHGWRALLPLFLALLVWLWMRAERLGPLLPPPPMDRRSLLEHVQASGEHLYRYGRRATLYAAVHEAFMRRLRQRDPYAAALDGPAQIEAIAKRTGLSKDEVDAALRYPRSGDRKDFVQRIARLLQLRRQL
jgi:Domain of unknown function (DUF4350)